MAQVTDSDHAALRILIADDEAAILDALSRFLRRDGHTVQTAETAQSALVLAAEHRFDVVLADVNMPGDGRKILAHLKDDPSFSGRLVLMTGGSAADYVEELGEGIDYLEKPFTFHVLRKLIRISVT